MTDSGRLLNLPPERRELLNQLLRQRRSTADGIKRRAAGMSVVPASFGQKRIWFLDQLQPGLPVYQISAALPVPGDLDPALLERSLNAVVQRHESLRTTFSEIDGELFQVIADHLEIQVRVFDLTGFSSRMSEVSRIGSADATQPFDLAGGPLLRLTLLRLDEKQSILLLAMHHIISDGWSMTVLCSELSALYAAFLAGEASPLPELPIQYADYALWQREHLTEDLVARDLAYWRTQLQGSARLRIPVDYPGANRTHRGARAFFRLGTARTRKLSELSRQTGTTLFMTLLAAFQVLLGRYTGQDDFVIGTPVAGRYQPETEKLIGFLLNTVCLRTNLRDDPDFFTLLQRVRQTALDAYAHQELPFERVVEEIGPERRFSSSGLFDVMFVLQPGPSWRLLDDVDPSSAPQSLDWEFESGTAKFDLTLSMAETATELVGALEYSTDLFQASAARRMVDHFTTTIDSILAEPNTRISKLKMLTAAEEEQILYGWNTTLAPFREDVRVEQLIAEQAALSPDAAAIICEESQIGYSTLCHEANQIAHSLLGRIERPGSRVGIFMQHGRRLLPALLGTWSAGCTYVPMDCESPVERTRFILTDAAVDAVLTEQHLLERLPRDTKGLLCLDDEGEAISRQDADSPRVKATPDDAAYIIYTSGSTGKPKGVVISHRSVVNYLTWINRSGVGTPPKLMPAITKITFDGSLKQLFAPLLRGDPVWLIPEQVSANVPELVQAIGERGDFTLNCVPWLWNAVMDTLSRGDFEASRCLKKLLLGGEEIKPELIQRTFKFFPDLEVWNLYGPTEATANATAQRLHPGKPISIGRPVANCTGRVLDAHGQLVPVGVVGELHLGGAGIASGYWNQPQLTQEHFIRDLFAAIPGSRLYKTGDLVRYCEDGTLTFAGRIDRLVKVHGCRIEPGEIEAVLSRHPEVSEAAVVLAGSDQAPRLVAYVELKHGDNPAGLELRRFAARNLPYYMVPTEFVAVERLPRTPHGKLDLSALALPRDGTLSGTATVVAARDNYEETIADIWASVLDVKCVGVQTSFFEIGGHSLLLAIQIMSRIRQAFAVEVPLRVLFETPTVEALANIVRQSKTLSRQGSFPAIERLDRDAWKSSTNLS